MVELSHCEKLQKEGQPMPVSEGVLILEGAKWSLLTALSFPAYVRTLPNILFVRFAGTLK